MNAWTLSGLAAVLSVILKAHLTIAAVGMVVTVSVPWAILAAILAASAVLLRIAVREIRGSRPSPYPRPVANWSIT